MRHFFYCLLAFGSLAFVCVAQAAETERVSVQPAPSWIVNVSPPASRSSDGALEIRLLDIQTRVDAEGLHQYFHQLVRILTPEGLAIAGNFGVAWQPGISEAAVHTVEVRRSGAVTNALGDGSGFQVIRREADLEKLQLNGVISAILPIQDLRVGDEVETAWTMTEHNPVLGGQAETRQSLAQGTNYGRLFMRFSWPDGRGLRTRIGSGFPKAISFKNESDQGFVIDRTDFVVPPLPDGAPARFLFGNAIELSTFENWRAVAESMRPLYETASRVAPASPIHAEIRRIAALSPKPDVRASAALRLVQGEVRYFARTDGLGGYKPETADAVWAGRVGDCKGKAVLLLALLHGLGIDADAALVSSGGGDGIDASLPALLQFNHVIVRASIGGKTYWLDGTRLGDRDVSLITVPPFKWALPVGPNTDALVRLVRTEPGTPQIEWRLDLDARAGIDKPAIAAGTAIFRGDDAEEWRVALAVMTVANREQMLRNTWSARHSFVKVEQVGSRYDDKTGDLQLDMTGTAEMDWNNKGDQVYNNYEADRATLGNILNVKRPEALQAVAPVYVAPRFVATHQTILLPDGGRGFRLSGVPINTVIGGVHYSRTQSLVGERFTMSTTTHSGEAELSYAEAAAADKATDELVKKRLFIELPPQMASRPGEIRQIEPPAVGVRLTGRARLAEMIAGTISDQDYPADAIRKNQQGVAGVNFDIGVDGHVTACRIAISSGFTALDDTSCALIRERFLFRPALGPKGQPRAETRFQRIRWKLPEDAAPIRSYDVTLRYTVGIEGVGRDCAITGTPPPPSITPEQCAKASQGSAILGADGNPVEAKIVEHHTRTVERMAPPAAGTVPALPVVPVPVPPASSGNPH